MSNDQIVDLGEVKAEIVSYTETKGDNGLPALALKASPAAQGSLEYVRTMPDHENFEITTVSPHDERFVRIFLNTKDSQGILSDVGVTFLVPTAMITVAFALMLAPGSFKIILLNSASARLSSGMLVEGNKRILSKISFPPLPDARHESIQSALSNVSGAAYANPFFPGGKVDHHVASHFDVDDFGINNYTRAAQGRLLSVFSSLSRGDTIAAPIALNLARQLAETYSFGVSNDVDALSPEVRENINVYKYTAQYLISAILHSTPREDMAVPVQEMSWEATDMEVERSFVEIISTFLNGESSQDNDETPMSSVKYMSELPDQEKQNIRVPFTAENIPETQRSIHDYIRKEVGEERYSKIVEYAQYNWLRAEVLNVTLEQEAAHREDVFLGLLLIIAARAELVKQSSSSGSNSAYWLTSILTMNGDARLWEILALAPSLVNYDISTLEDLMHTNGRMSQDPRAKKLFFYINLFINGLAAFFLMEEIDKEDVSALFEELELDRASINDVHELFMELLDMLEEDYEDLDEASSEADLPEYTIPGFVVEAMIERWTEPRISRALSLAVPVLADAYATLEGHEIGTSEWTTYRKAQIEEILFYVDEIAPGVHR